MRLKYNDSSIFPQRAGLLSQFVEAKLHAAIAYFFKGVVFTAIISLKIYRIFTKLSPIERM